jgi:hypothetical protein
VCGVIALFLEAFVAESGKSSHINIESTEPAAAMLARIDPRALPRKSRARALGNSVVWPFRPISEWTTVIMTTMPRWIGMTGPLRLIKRALALPLVASVRRKALARGEIREWESWGFFGFSAMECKKVQPMKSRSSSGLGNHTAGSSIVVQRAAILLLAANDDGSVACARFFRTQHARFNTN